MKSSIDYSVYFVTDRGLMSTKTVEESVERAILGGATVVQLREKDISSRDFFDEAMRVKAVCARYGVPMIVNDRIDVALAVDADGVHLGQSDIPAFRARRLIGGKILGVSATNLAEAKQAAADGADYLGVGAMFGTFTKTDAQLVSLAELERIKSKVPLPVVVIGGINEKTLPLFDKVDIDGVAVVSAIAAKADVTAAAREIRRLFFAPRRVRAEGKSLALFDLDGTLLDSLSVWERVDELFFSARGRAVPDDFFARTMAMSFDEIARFVIGEYGFSDTPERLVAEWNAAVENEYAHNIFLKPYAREYLAELEKSGVEAAVVTGLPANLARAALKNNGLEGYFKGVFSVDEVGEGKNGGRIYAHALAQMRTDADKAVLFEDSAAAAEAGKRLGLYVVGINDYRNDLQSRRRLLKASDFFALDFCSAPQILK